MTSSGTLSTSQLDTEHVGSSAKREPRARAREAVPIRVGERYVIERELGRGGAAVVYAARDQATGRTLALKRLAAASSKKWGTLCSLFEREFHLLTQLSHPRVIEVYDYAIEDGVPYYTMELLDGGDLRKLAPLPWREVCALIYDVCSSLALLHSRRFVHRDVSPLNIHRTRAGYAKLLDFGAALPMGVATHLVGTPAFVPPEALHRGSLDARSDLYALGATCYYVLSGELAYRARTFGELQESWRNAPVPLSVLVPEIPAALDELVMSLLSLDSALRPPTAWSVMQRLSAIAQLPHAESQEVARSYLSAPRFVGRDGELAAIQQKLAACLQDSGSATLVLAPRGAGRTRLLDASVFAAKALGARVLRAGADQTRKPFSVVERLLEQLYESGAETLWSVARAEGVAECLFEAELNSGAEGPPALRELGTQPAERSREQAALECLVLALARETPLVIAVDDVHDIDDASASWLASVSARCEDARLLLLLAADSEALGGALPAFRVLRIYCEPLELPALDRAASAALVESVFGDVPNLALVSRQLYERARGNPASMLSLADWLVERGIVRYEAGAWSLPEQLVASDLPLDREHALLQRLQHVSALARELAAAQALAVVGVFSRQDYLMLARERSVTEVERALLELASAGIVTSDGEFYELKNRELVARSLVSVDARQQLARQRALTRVFQQPDKPLVLAVPHMLACGREAEALARLMQHFASELVQEPKLDYVPVLPYPQLMQLYQQALQFSSLLTPRELGELRRRLLLLSVVDDASVYYDVAPGWLAQLRRDSGLERWHALALDASLSPEQRLTRALTEAMAEYEATPEPLRSYRPDEAIRMLAQYVVISLAVGGHHFDRALVSSLPALLEPFAGLSPALCVIWENARGTCALYSGQRLRGRAHLGRAFEQLSHLSSSDFPYLQSMRNAIALSLCAVESMLGLLDSAQRWIKLLDEDPMQRVNAMYLRKIVVLQEGNWERSQEYRKQAELLALSSNVRQMFSLHHAELTAHARVGDLAGVRHVCERIDVMCERSPHAAVLAALGRGLFQQLRGDWTQAEVELRDCLERSDPRTHGPTAAVQAFCMAASAYVEVLTERAELERAHAWGSSALCVMQQHDLEDGSWELERALAMVEGKLPGLAEVAAQRIMRLIALQTELGIHGLRLGACYEARARLALWAGDQETATRYAGLTAHAYRYGAGCMLGARYERLREEARQYRASMLPQLG